MKAAERVERERGKEENLGPSSDFEWGMINGKLWLCEGCWAMSGTCSTRSNRFARTLVGRWWTHSTNQLHRYASQFVLKVTSVLVLGFAVLLARYNHGDEHRFRSCAASLWNIPPPVGKPHDQDW